MPFLLEQFGHRTTIGQLRLTVTPMPGTPESGAVISKARELVAFACAQGYRRDELLELIERLA